MHLKYINQCRVCGNEHLHKFLDLGCHFLHGNFVYPNKPVPPTRKTPIQVLRCQVEKGGCGAIQLAHSIPPEILYAEYGYRSTQNSQMMGHIRSIAEDLVLTIGNDHFHALEIGCNNGFFLKCLPDLCVKVGVDPSSAIDEIKPEDDIITHKRLFPFNGLGKFDAAVSIAMFYDLENPADFVFAIKDCLKSQGVWVVEFGYLVSVLERVTYDYFCGEHLNLFSLATFEYLLKQAGLKLFRARLNNVNGGSIQCWVTHNDNDIYDRKENLDYIQTLRNKEFDMELDTHAPYLKFANKVYDNIANLRDFIREEVKDGKKIFLLGASTKSNVVLESCHFTSEQIPFASDRSPLKWGAKTLTGIPIISEEESRAKKPDYYLALIHFRESVIEREQEFIKNGGKIIFNFPQLEVFP